MNENIKNDERNPHAKPQDTGEKKISTSKELVLENVFKRVWDISRFFKENSKK